MASPKLIESCCIELAIVLAMLELRASMSAYAIEFMLENWRELKLPCAKLKSKMKSTGVLTLIKEKRETVRPIMSVLTINTFRYP